jgi:PAS domain S-box-containing protein
MNLAIVFSAICIKGESVLKGENSGFVPYILTVLTVGVTLLLTLLLQSLLTPNIFPLFFVAVAISIYYGGTVPGLLAIALSILSISFVEPAYSPWVLGTEDVLYLSVFVLETTLMGLLNFNLRTAKQYLETSLQQLKTSEAKFRSNEERYRAFLEQSTEGIWCFELEQPISSNCSEEEQIQHFYRYGYLRDCNDVTAQMYGFSRAEEIVGAKLKDFLVAANPHNIEYLRNFIRSGYRLIDAESYEVDRYGNCKYFLNNLVGILENGILVRAWGTQREITECKRVEDALRESESRFRALADATIEGVVIHENGKVLDANPAFAKIFGYEFNEVIGKSAADFVTPESQKIVLEKIQSDNQQPYELTGIKKDGTHISLEVIGRSSLYQSRNVRVASVRDITERKQTQTALRQREEELHLITNSVPVLISYVDAEQRYRFNNKKYEDWYGLSAAEFYGKHIKEVVGDSVYESIRPYIETVLSGKQVSYETQIPFANGDTRYVHVSYVPHLHQTGEVKGFVALINEITDRKLAEQEREKLLASEKAARTEAETANRMKDEFLATLSHELRTPLNAMLGWTQLLTSRKFDEATTARALETIDRNTKSLTMLIEDVLNVSRIIRGTLHLNLRRIELVSIVKAALDVVSPAAAAKKIQIESEFDPTVGVVIGDGNRLQQVVWNLLANAVKFTPQGGRIDVQVKRTDDSVQIWVQDTGEGISPEFLPYVFDRFRQGDSSNTRSHGGLGLGLAIVRYLVELHGGIVCAHSSGIGQGATFMVHLPMRAVDMKANSSQLLSPTLGEQVSQEHILFLKGLRVLVVDDEEDTRELLLTILGEYRAEVIAVGSVPEALDTLPHFQPDVIVSDIGMPQEDGYTLIRQVRSLPHKQWRSTPAVALTAHATAEDRAQALLAGFQFHVPKPVNPTELAVVVANLAGRREGIAN